jgi:magnesium-transporting ATPase (P-type)
MGVSLRAALVMMKYSVIGLTATQFTDGSLLMMGLEMRDYIVVAVGCLIVFAVSVMKEMGVNIREGIANRALPVRWCAYYALILIIIVFGYTNGVSSFLYANF